MTLNVKLLKKVLAEINSRPVAWDMTSPLPANGETVQQSLLAKERGLVDRGVRAES